MSNSTFATPNDDSQTPKDDSQTPPKRRRCNSLNIATKAQIIKLIESGVKNSKLAKQYGVSASTVSTIWANKKKIMEAYQAAGEKSVQMKRSRPGTYEDIEKEMLVWLNALRDTNLPLNGTVLTEKALSIAKSLNIAEFKASASWLGNFKRRHNITKSMLSGEDDSGNREHVDEWNQQLASILCGYRPKDIFNIDETEISYKCLPTNEKCAGEKCCKEFVTCVIGTNANGTEKLNLLVIGKQQLPSGFWKHVEYSYKSRPFLTEDIFTEWLIRQDKQFALARRQVLVFIDNCPVRLDTIQNQLQSITLHYFPSHVTKNVQPLHVGIISSLKAHYRHRMLKKNVRHWEDRGENYEISLSDFIREFGEAWKQDVTASTIADCFAKVGFKTSELEVECDPLLAAKIEVEICSPKIEESESSDSEEAVSDYGGPSNAEVEVAIETLRSAFQIYENVPDNIHQALNKIERFCNNRNKVQRRNK